MVITINNKNNKNPLRLTHSMPLGQGVLPNKRPLASGLGAHYFGNVPSPRVLPKSDIGFKWLEKCLKKNHILSYLLMGEFY
jgi:hypothetical protein